MENLALLWRFRDLLAAQLPLDLGNRGETPAFHPAIPTILFCSTISLSPLPNVRIVPLAPTGALLSVLDSLPASRILYLELPRAAARSGTCIASRHVGRRGRAKG